MEKDVDKEVAYGVALYYHEAAHAVIGEALGLAVRKIVYDGDGSACVEFDGPDAPGLPATWEGALVASAGVASTDLLQERSADDLQTARYRGDRPDSVDAHLTLMRDTPLSVTDEENVAAYLNREVSSWVPARKAEARRARAVARGLVNEHWEVIERVGEAMSEKEVAARGGRYELSRAEILAAMRGDKSPATVAVPSNRKH